MAFWLLDCGCFEVGGFEVGGIEVGGFELGGIEVGGCSCRFASLTRFASSNLRFARNEANRRFNGVNPEDELRVRS